MRVRTTILISLLAALAALSCEQVIALDKSISNAEGSTDKNGEFDETAGGNPSEDIAEGPDSPSGAYTDQSTSTDATAPMSDDEQWNGDEYSDGEAAYSDADTATMPDSSVSDEGNYTDSDPTTAFSLDDCACGDAPVYGPVCCDGMTTVFNNCFANCMNAYTGQCAERTGGICGETNDGADDDSVTETPDDDTITVGTCDCVPADVQAWCCDGGARYISECAASCACKGPYALCD